METPSYNIHFAQGLESDEMMAQLKAMCTNGELAVAHSRFSTERKRDQALQEEYNVANKNGKGKLALAYVIDPTRGEVFQTMTKTLLQSKKMEKVEQWLPEKQLRKKFGDEFDMHVNSGRISWRECMRTPGVYEYLDTEDVKLFTGVEKQKVTKQSQELGGLMDGQVDEFDDWFAQILLSSGTTESLRDFDIAGKGTSKGKGEVKGKGKGGKGGKGEPVPQPIPLPDMTEEQMVEDSKDKSRKMNIIMQKTVNDLEELSINMKSSKFYNKQIGLDFANQMQKVGKHMKYLKAFITSSKDLNSEQAKLAIVAAAGDNKAAANFVRDMKAVMSKEGDTQSVKSKKSRN